VWRLIRLSVAVGIGLIAGVLVVADNALHVPHEIAPRESAADAIARNTGASWEKSEITSRDGILLDAWLFTPHHPNGSGVIALHGVADTRLGMLAHAAFLLRSGFTVLVPDVRGHGASGGSLITYGVKEAGDVRDWADWLFRNQKATRLYGIGQSMGAAILLQSVNTELRFRALVADSPFATFEEISYDRLHQISRLPKLLLRPVVPIGFAYTRLRYGVNLWQASPLEAIRATSVPILLIHGADDTNIPVRHSQELHRANPRATSLWVVPGADHVASLSADPEKYSHRVIEWFTSHP
jgi:uncharacterized protein